MRKQRNWFGPRSFGRGSESSSSGHTAVRVGIFVALLMTRSVQRWSCRAVRDVLLLSRRMLENLYPMSIAILARSIVEEAVVFNDTGVPQWSPDLPFWFGQPSEVRTTKVVDFDEFTMLDFASANWPYELGPVHGPS